MAYRYEGNFKSEDSGYEECRPEISGRFFYCDIYPGMINEETGFVEYKTKPIRVRIIPHSVDSVLITGWNGVFDIFPFNDKYALLDNASRNVKLRRMALISISDIRKCFLSIKER